ncbi:MAG: hypothetical protein IPG04_16970 [Polyangiaceae bacterium]|jgi:hypothetical protein|nr:hypothetical protein [Polyangiaceae bacterium]
MERTRLGLGALALSLALLTSAVGCSSTAGVDVPERVARGAEVVLTISASGPLVSTECTGQLDCSRDSAYVESITFDPPDLVEVVEEPELPASYVALRVRAKRSGTVTVTFEGDFGSEERVMEIEAPASSDLYDANDPDFELPAGFLLAPGQPKVCAPPAESFDTTVWIGLDVLASGTCTLELRTEGGLSAEVSEEL